MKEHQNVARKEFWRDDYLRWICGFANADGGTLVIWNPRHFPPNLTIEKLLGKHAAKPPGKSRRWQDGEFCAVATQFSPTAITTGIK